MTNIGERQGDLLSDITELDLVRPLFAELFPPCRDEVMQVFSVE